MLNHDLLPSDRFGLDKVYCISRGLTTSIDHNVDHEEAFPTASTPSGEQLGDEDAL